MPTTGGVLILESHALKVVRKEQDDISLLKPK
jgi:hypothetical protein